jgi:hypothetical protein
VRNSCVLFEILRLVEPENEKRLIVFCLLSDRVLGSLDRPDGRRSMALAGLLMTTADWRDERDAPLLILLFAGP